MHSMDIILVPKKGDAALCSGVSALKVHYRHWQRAAATRSWVGSMHVHHFLCSTGLPEGNS